MDDGGLMDALISDDAADAYEQLRDERLRTLLGPEDDMWAAFADLAEPHSLTYDGQLVGRFSLDDERRLHGFYVREEFEPRAADLLDRVVAELDVSAVLTSTVDPTLLALTLAAGGTARSTGLMYDHVHDSVVDDTLELRVAGDGDHESAVAFVQTELNSSGSFEGPYLAQRIELGELYLLEVAGSIVASGECRVDTRSPGNAHLGLVVGTHLRGQGLGSRLMHTLTEIALNRDLIPRCSTEPTNKAAQQAIRRAGFRNRHHVLSVELP